MSAATGETRTRARTTSGRAMRAVKKPVPAKKRAAPKKARPAAKRGASRPVAGTVREGGRRSAGRATSPTLTTLRDALASVEGRLDELLGLVRELAGRPGLEASARSASKASKASNGLTEASFDDRLLAATRDVDARGRYGGLVPIPEVRRALSDILGSPTAFNEALLKSERRFVVDLKTANDRRLSREPELCIDDPGRGLLEYVVIR